MRVPFLVLAAGLAVSACATTPNDVVLEQRTLDQGALETRQGTFGAAPASQISATDPAGAGSVGEFGGGGFSSDTADLASRAESAILEAEAQAGATPQGGVFDNIQPQQADDLLPAPVIPRVAAFAIRTSHQPGERRWRRNPFTRPGTAACASFEHPDLAQDRFLAEGGPERDRLRLDPDGDGFVCGFDPRPLRAQANGVDPEPAFPAEATAAAIAPPLQISTEPAG